MKDGNNGDTGIRAANHFHSPVVHRDSLVESPDAANDGYDGNDGFALPHTLASLSSLAPSQYAQNGPQNGHRQTQAQAQAHEVRVDDNAHAQLQIAHNQAKQDAIQATEAIVRYVTFVLEGDVDYVD